MVLNVNVQKQNSATPHEELPPSSLTTGADSFKRVLGSVTQTRVIRLRVSETREAPPISDLWRSRTAPEKREFAHAAS